MISGLIFEGRASNKRCRLKQQTVPNHPSQTDSLSQCRRQTETRPFTQSRVCRQGQRPSNLKVVAVSRKQSKNNSNCDRSKTCDNSCPRNRKLQLNFGLPCMPSATIGPCIFGRLLPQQTENWRDLTASDIRSQILEVQFQLPP